MFCSVSCRTITWRPSDDVRRHYPPWWRSCSVGGPPVWWYPHSQVWARNIIGKKSDHSGRGRGEGVDRVEVRGGRWGSERKRAYMKGSEPQWANSLNTVWVCLHNVWDFKNVCTAQRSLSFLCYSSHTCYRSFIWQFHVIPAIEHVPRYGTWHLLIELKFRGRRIPEIYFRL